MGGLVVTDRGYSYLTWDALGDDETGDYAAIGSMSDKTVQVTGTWASATLVLQGSMDNVTWFPLTDIQGVALSFTGNGMKLIAENPRFIRPVTSGGSGTDVDCIVGGATR